MHQEITEHEQRRGPAMTASVAISAARARREQNREAMRMLNAALDHAELAFGALAEFSEASFVTADRRAIDRRECDALEPADTDWGEQDSLSNVPRKAARCA